MLNGEIVTGSESDDPSTCLQPKSLEFEAVIEKIANAIGKQVQRKRAKMIANQLFFWQTAIQVLVNCCPVLS